MAKPGGNQQGQTRVFFALVAGLVLFAPVVGAFVINDEAAAFGAQAGSALLATADLPPQLVQPAAVSECQRIIALDAKLSTNITCITGQDGTDYIEATVRGPLMLSSTHRSYVTYGSQP